MRVHLFLVICRIWVHLLSIPIRYVDADRAVTVEGSVIENGSIPPPLTVFNETSVNTTRKYIKIHFKLRL